MKLTWLVMEFGDKHSHAATELNSDTLSDRAIGILAASYVQFHLVEAIKKRLIRIEKLPIPKEEKTLFERMFGESDGSLKFSQSIDLSCALGITSPNTHHDLTMIRKVRNKFAHEWPVVDFNTTDPNIKHWCNSLKIPQSIHAGNTGKFAETTRDKYLVACHAICVCIYEETYAKKYVEFNHNKYNDIFSSLLTPEQRMSIAKKLSTLVFAPQRKYISSDTILKVIDDLENNNPISPPNDRWKEEDSNTIRHAWIVEKVQYLLPSYETERPKSPTPKSWD